MDIGSGKRYPSSSLSNFSPHPFVFEGVEVASMEGLVQSFKFDKVPIQEHVCTLVGHAAKKRGKKRNKAWKSRQTLWWKGVAYARHGPEYQRLLDRAFDALAENKSFRDALLATQKAVLRHSIGSSKRRNTVLTEREFCSRLTRIRERLQ